MATTKKSSSSSTGTTKKTSTSKSSAASKKKKTTTGSNSNKKASGSTTKKNTTSKNQAAKKSTSRSTSKKSSSAKSKKNQKNKSMLGPVLLVIFIALFGVYLYRGYQIKDCFFNGISINHIDVRGMTVAEVEEALTQRAANYQLTISGREGAEATISSADIGYGYVSDGTIQKCFDEQNWLFWGFGYLGGNALKESREVTVEMSYDETLLQNCMNSWSFITPEGQRSPIDASISYENGQYVIIGEVQGTALDTNILYESLIQAVDTTAATLNIEDTGAYYPPAVTSDNAILQENVTTLNSYANCTIIHELPNGETTGIEPETLRSWLSADGEGRYYKDDSVFASHIENYVSELNTKVNSCNTGKMTFWGQDGVNHTISTGTVKLYWTLDTAAEIQKLTEELANNTSLTREPVYSSRARASSGALANTYVEIDLSGQHLWYFKDGTIVLDCDITSGTYNIPERRTPEGLYKIAYKQKDRILRGDLLPGGTYEYESPVTYWMPFNGNIGLHDASWRDPDRFGGSIYLNNGSHGCINMPTTMAASLYSQIEKGCLVVCYY